jgi:hypothetical protein
VTRVRLYFDDDSSSKAILAGLARVGIEALTSDDHGMRGADDGDHLRRATSLQAAIYSSNVRDYAKLHSQWMRSGLHHTGIVLVVQQRWGTGELLRRLARLSDALSAEEMADRLEHLGDWGEPQ